VDVSPNRRGYNLVALDRADGRVLGAAAFDTHADPAASRRLAEWVAGLPQGAVVAAAVRDEASFNLGQEAIEALRSLGSTVDLRGRFRWSHALIGAVGAPPGSAQEQVSGWRVEQVTAGLPATAPQVAAALAGVEIIK
ncbi:MAG: interleukin-like EMT inducer domain-containing protein, partial [Anaerolineae bacterium]